MVTWEMFETEAAELAAFGRERIDLRVSFLATIRVHDTSVSRLHIRLHLGATLQIEDLGSANGTSLGGNR